MSQKKQSTDNILSISDGSIKRLGHVAGVRRMTGKIPEYVKELITEYLTQVLKKVVLYLEYSKKKIVKQGMVSESLNFTGVVSSKKDNKCPIKHFKTKTVAHAKDGREWNVNRGPSVAINKIRYAQHNSDCLVLAKAPFTRLCRELTSKYVEDVRFSKESLVLLQYSTESYIIDLLIKAQRVSINGKRVTINVEDLKLAKSISE